MITIKGRKTRTVGIHMALKEEIKKIIQHDDCPFNSEKQFVDFHIKQAIKEEKARYGLG